MRKEKIPAVYKITNTVTGDFYIGSSVDVKGRWRQHKSPKNWERCPNTKMYQDMQTYGVDKFKFDIIVSIMPECLKRVEQDCIDLMHPTYNQVRAMGHDIERYKENDKIYRKTEKRKRIQKEASKKYLSQLCNYNGETLTLGKLSGRFSYYGIPHPVLEAKKYLI